MGQADWFLNIVADRLLNIVADWFLNIQVADFFYI